MPRRKLSTRPPFLIRKPHPGEEESLTALALRAKAHWGYSPAFVEACRADIRLSGAYLAKAPVGVADIDGKPAGFYGLSIPGAEHELVHLWIEPAHIGRGLGTLLWKEALKAAAALGWTEFRIISDPHAAGFYERMGARRLGQEPSRVDPARLIPVFCYVF